MCHLAHRIVRAFLAAKGVIIFQHQCAEVGQLDFHIRMQMPEIESAAAYILARATKRDSQQVTFCKFRRAVQRARDRYKNLCPVEDEHHLGSFKCAASHVVLKFELIHPM